MSETRPICPKCGAVKSGRKFHFECGSIQRPKWFQQSGLCTAEQIKQLQEKLAACQAQLANSLTLEQSLADNLAACLNYMKFEADMGDGFSDNGSEAFTEGLAALEEFKRQ